MKKVNIQLEMMFRYSAKQKKELLNEFRGTKQTNFEKKLQGIIEKMIPEKEYHPRKHFPFIFIYKIGELLVVFVFYNGWRIEGKYDPEGELSNLTKKEMLSLQEIIGGE